MRINDVAPLDEDEFAQPVVVGADLIDDEGPRGVEEDLLSDLQASDDATHTVMVGSEGLGGPQLAGAGIGGGRRGSRIAARPGRG